MTTTTFTGLKMALSLLLLLPLLSECSVSPTPAPNRHRILFFSPTVAPTDILKDIQITGLVTTKTTNISEEDVHTDDGEYEHDFIIGETLSSIIQSIYLALAIYLLIVQRLKFKYLPDDIKTFSLCKVLNLKRLAYIVVIGTIFKVLMYFFLCVGLPWIVRVEDLPCHPDGRYFFWANKVFIGFFVALRTRLSVSSTENKWYKVGILIISVGVILFFLAILRISISPAACAQGANPQLALIALTYDFFGEIYMLAVFIIPMRKTIAVLQAISGGKPNIRLTLWINKVMIYSSIIILSNLVMMILMPIATLCSHPSTGHRNIICIQLLHNTSLLVASYCVVVQFDVKLDAVKSKRIKWMLRSFDCNNCAAKYCNSLLTSTAESELAETVRKDNTIDSGPDSGQSAENRTEEIQTVGPSIGGKDNTNTIDSGQSTENGTVELQIVGPSIDDKG